MDIHHEDMARSKHGEDAAQSADDVEPGSGVNVAPAPTEPNVVPPRSKQPAPSSIAPTVDAVGPVQ